MANVSVKLLTLATMLSLAACSPTLMTPTGGISQPELNRAVEEAINNLVRETCETAWRPTTYSSRDTAETQLGNRANNAAREAYCEA